MKPDPMQKLSEMESRNDSKALGRQVKNLTWYIVELITWQAMPFLTVSIVFDDQSKLCPTITFLGVFVLFENPYVFIAILELMPCVIPSVCGCLSSHFYIIMS